MMIVCYYIEVDSDQNRVNLERVIRSNGYAFYDATANEPLCFEKTIEDIETRLENK